MNSKDYIASGILELYVAGSLSEKENQEVYEAMQKYPEVLAEVESIENAILQLTAAAKKDNTANSNNATNTANSSGNATPKKKKLSFKEARELEALPEKIDELETLIESLQAQINDADFFSQDEETTQKVLNQLAESESNLEIVYNRWQELDDE